MATRALYRAADPRAPAAASDNRSQHTHSMTLARRSLAQPRPRPLSLSPLLLLPLLLPLLLLLAAPALAQYSFEVPSTCPTTTTFFDTTAYQCSACPPNQVATGLQSPACACQPGWAASPGAASCTECVAPLVPRRGGASGCLACDGVTATYDAAALDCVCANAALVLVETTASGAPLAAKQCVLCPANAIVSDTDPYACVACDDPLMTRNAAAPYACGCPTGYTLVGTTPYSRCLPASSLSTLRTSYPPAQVSQISYPAVRSTDSGDARAVTVFSPLLAQWFDPSALACKGLLDATMTAAAVATAVRTACQTAVNLCVLAMSNMAHPACRFVQTHTLTISDVVWGFSDWRQSMPFSFYSDAPTALDNGDIATTVALTGANAADLSRQSRLSYRLQTFALNGTLLASTVLATELHLCPAVVAFASSGLTSSGTAATSATGADVDMTSTRFLNVGATYESSCTLELLPLAEGLRDADPVFYELFFTDTGGRWYPVPVLVKDLRDGSLTYNTDVSVSARVDNTRTRVLRRFFLADGAATAPSTGALPAVLTYAKRVTLRVTMRSGSVQKIKPPVLVLEYASRLQADYSSASTSRRRAALSFSQQYVKGLGSAAVAAYVMFALIMVWVILIWIVKLIVLANKERAGGMGLGAVMAVFAQLLGIWGEWAFWLVFAFATYLFIFFKGQDEVHVLMPVPPKSVFGLCFGPFLITATVCCLIALIVRVYRQISVDVLFIDWEAPPPTSAYGHNAGGGGGGGSLGSVSAWRKVLVANKWQSLQARRVIALAPTLCVLLFLLYGVGLEGLSTAQPDGGNLSADAAPIDPILRFFVTSVIFLGLAGLQRAFASVVTDCFVPRPTTQFLDLLSSTNISCCIFDAKHHMFYLHGQTVHARADASMEELHRQLLRERRNWVHSRGLVAEESSFSVFLTPAFRGHYDAEYGAVLHRHQQMWQRQVRQ